MFPPLIAARVKQTHQVTSLGVNRRNVASLVPIAGQACAAQVLERCYSTVFFRQDVIHLQAKEGVVFVNQTVLARIVGSSANLTAQRRWNVSRTYSRYWRALALASRIKCSSSRPSASVATPLFWRSSSSLTRATAFSEGWKHVSSPVFANGKAITPNASES